MNLHFLTRINVFKRASLFILVFFLVDLSFSQTGSIWQVDSIIIVSKNNYKFQFPERHRYKKQSLRINKNGVDLREINDYSFIDAYSIKFFPAPAINDTFRIYYSREPFNLKRSYTLFTRDTLVTESTDSLSGDSTQVRLVQQKFENPFADFGSGLQKSGSIMRGVNIGTNRDLTLNSGLNLELSGQLSENVEIIAALTDETTPIQPEGNTQSLDEIDRVFVKFKSPFVEGTVGDLNLQYSNTQFADLTRKLQGISLLGNYADQFAGATVATTRGFFNRQTFIGQEGNQGPYQLAGKDGEREIIVLAGTERVWINGQKMLRGETNDYIIEYANGQITFTNNRLVTSESRIEIDFEYFPAIQKYNRNVLSGLYGGKVFNNKLNYRLSFYQEKDNTDQSLGEEENLTAIEKNILQAAGDDPVQAALSGENLVGAGKGSYVKKDTVQFDSTFTIFEYRGSGLGDYFVSFTFVGSAKGDYVRDRLGQYRWVGPQKGDYKPIRLVPLPQKHQLTDMQIEWKPTSNIKVTSEYAFSNLDRNTLSSLQNSDNQGDAFFVDARASDIKTEGLGLNIGVFDFDINTRLINRDFQAVDRFSQPDFQRYWNVLQTETVSSDEKSVQFNSRYRPFQGLSLSLNIGSLNKDNLESQRYGSTLNFDKQNWFKSDITFETVNSSLSDDNVDNNWKRLNSEIYKDIGLFQPGVLYQFENRRNTTPALLSGFRFDDIGLRLAFINWNYFNGFIQLNERKDKVYDVQADSRLVPQASTETRRLKLQTQNIDQTTVSLEIVQRKKDYTKRFENIKLDTLKLLFADASVQDTVWQDRETNLAELKLSHSRWKKALSANLQYRISTEQTALREKVYIEVQQGRGNLRFDEDLQEYVPDPDGNFVLFVLPSGKFEPVTKLESALRLTYDPSRVLKKEGGLLQKLAANLSGSSYFRIEEETKEEDLAAIYLLDFNKFQRDKTLRGSLVYDQDLYIMKRNRQLNFRLLYRYRDDLFNQFLDTKENEDRLTIERGFRTDWRISSKIKSQSEIRQKDTKRVSNANSTRNRNIAGYFLNQKIFYKPFERWEFKIDGEYGQEDNSAAAYPINLWFAIAKTQANYVLAGEGRITADFEYQTVNTTFNPLGLTVPYEMARGKKKGISKKWQLRAEYTVSKNILFTFLYSGRDEAGFSDIIHTGQAEVRAFF